ncbi:hypothetical protein [Nocardiopsis sp. FIRDI 009]|uniref:hypothetical protein n=1 Tax=Nocardiopsis sp. FIRDI 009 TaxID=714197 RepID=UPI000E24632B|nr:hypothetical protein [Nocardiopsis sp. FIRDI 009]
MTLIAAARPPAPPSATRRALRAASALVTGTALAAALLMTAAGPAHADTTTGGATGTDATTGTGAATYDICPEVYYYVVPEGSPGLEAIADLILGDPERADEIYELNAGRAQADGGALGEDRVVRPGWRLVVPFDSGGDGVYEGRDPLCVVAVDQANALGLAPPSPPPAPPAYTPPPSEEPTEEVTDLTPREDESRVDPRLLGAGAAGLVLLTLLTLFWQPVLAALAWPFRRLAALPWRRPRKPRAARAASAARERRAATEMIAADPGAASRAGAAHADLLAAATDGPVRPVALLTSATETTAVVPAGSTPPSVSWRVVDATTWRQGGGRGPAAPVHFGTAALTSVGTAVRGVLVCLGRQEGTDMLVHLDFTRLRGLLAVGGDEHLAADTVRVVADQLHAAGLTVRVLKPGRPLHALVPDTIPTVVAPDPVQGVDPGPERPEVVFVPRPLGPADEHVLTNLPPHMIVVAPGTSRTARWQWEAHEDGTVDTGALGLRVVVRLPERRA